MSGLTRQHELLLDAIAACGAARGIVWVTAAETTGDRELSLLVELDALRSEMAADRPRFRVARWERIIAPNAAAAAATIERARELWPAYLVPNLVGLTVPEWNDDTRQYRMLKDAVFDRYARIAVAGPEWAFSSGERKRIQLALERGLPICDVDGGKLSVADVQAAVRDADDHIRLRLADHPRAEAVLAEVLPR